MRKRVWSILLALCMVLALLPATALAADPAVRYSGSCGTSARWVITDDGVMTITGTGTVTVPMTKEEARIKMSSVTALRVEDGITAIDTGAFQGFSTLKEVVVAGSVKRIGGSAFRDCTSLETAVLMDGVEHLDSAVFYGCTSLEDVYLPDTIRDAFNGTFENCRSLTSVRIPAQVMEIGSYTFHNCTSLENIILPGTVKVIDPNAFMNTPKFTELYYAGTEEMLYEIAIHPDGNEQLENVGVYLLPAMPDPVFGLFDMPARDNWAYPGIAFCLATELMNGVSDGYFDPSGTTTRAQLVTILWRMMDEPKATKPAPFADLSQDWYRDAVAWAAENNITDGTSDTTFSPNDPITREQMVTIFCRMCRDYLELDVSPSASLASFPDNGKVASWAKDAMQWAVAVKLITGVGDGRGNAFLEPQGKATRAQIATVMLNFYNAFAEE